MARLTQVLILAACLTSLCWSAPIDRRSGSTDGGDSIRSAAGTRNGRSILSSSWFDYLPSDGVSDQIMSRSSADDDPLNSPIYYIRLPPNPYSFVPGLGYVSQPDTSQAPVAPPPPPPPVRRNPFIQLPLEFVSNGKPGNTVLTWPSEPAHAPVTQRPKPKPRPKPAHTKPSVTKLKGPFFFNGKPSGMFILQQDPYNSLYADMLHNFYP